MIKCKFTKKNGEISFKLKVNNNNSVNKEPFSLSKLSIKLLVNLKP